VVRHADGYFNPATELLEDSAERLPHGAQSPERTR
jgi:hypothetical protein